MKRMNSRLFFAVLTCFSACFLLLMTTAVAVGQQENSEKTTIPAAATIYISDFPGMAGLKSYRIDKTVTEFPDKIDLSTPETAYVTQKILMYSDRPDKIEQLEKVHFTKIKIPERERKGFESIDAETGKNILSQYKVLEVILVGTDKAFVFGLQGHDMLYDGNNFQKKEDGLWYNQGNDQSRNPAQMAEQLKNRRAMTPECNSLKEFFSATPLTPTRVTKSYRIDKRIIDFPDTFDLSTPENSYATQKHLIISNAKDKIEQLAKMQFDGGKIPSGRERDQILQPVDEDWAITYKTEFVVFEVYQFGDDTAFVFAQRKFDNLYDGNFFKKGDDGLWYNGGNLQNFNPDAMAANVKRVLPRLQTLRSTHLAVIEKTDWFAKLNDRQKKYVRWDELQFDYVYNPANFNVGDARDVFEQRWLQELEQPEPGHPGHTTLSRYDEAIVGLATLQSKLATKRLIHIATERVVKDNAHRHFATKALGMLGDTSAVPALIPLVYHFNFNTRWDAQVALVRLTGRNFGTDAPAWGKWWNENRRTFGEDLPEYEVTPVDWSFGSTNTEMRRYCDPAFQEEMDTKFFLEL